MKLVLWILALCLLISGCTEPARVVRRTTPDLERSPDLLALRTAGYDIGEPILIDNISVIPVKRYGKQEPYPKPVVDYITLDEAVERKVIEITERKPAVVESLLARNLGDQPILLVGGELLVGGQQDRVVAHDAVIPPHKMVPVDVFCVEQGRWHGKKEFSSGESSVPLSVRGAALAEDQSGVWAKARGVNRDYLVPEGVTSVAEGSRAAQERTKAMLANFESRLDDPDLVGMVYAVNGKVLSVDIFASPRLFAASRRNLLQGFLADAASEKKLKSKAPEGGEVVGFLNQVMASKADSSVDSTGLSRVGGNGIAGAELRAESGAARSPAVHGYFEAD